MTKKQKKSLYRILAGAAALLLARFAVPAGIWQLLAYLAAYFIVGWDVLWRAVRNIAHGQVFDENFLMAVATVGALALGEYGEAVGVMLFYQVGELFQSCAVDKSRRSISDLMDIRPDSAHVEREGGTETVDPEEVAPGDIIQVRPGEKIPLDGTVMEGVSSVNTAALTGESLPRDVAPGTDALAGCINLTGLLRIRVTKPFGESTAAKILDLVENSASKKAKTENFITKFARYYTPAVVGGAVVLAIVPSLITGQWATWIQRALMFLVISCPCALVISVPLTFFGGIGGASARGILVKGGNYMELLSKTRTVAFDKTGTLTRGSFEVAARYPEAGVSEDELLACAALVESQSSHPIAQSLRRAYGREIDEGRVSDIQEAAGYGLTATVDGRSAAAGNARLMERLGLRARDVEDVGTLVHVALDGKYLGCLVIADQIKDTTPDVIAKLHAQGVYTVMLTGDSRKVGDAVGARIGLDEVHAQLLPADKVSELEALMEKRASAGALAYVGDGVNDAPVLSRADVGIAMGAMGSDAALEAADVVFMDDDLEKLPEAMSIARKCMSIAWQNIVFSLVVKGLFLLLGALGKANMWAAVFADVGVTVIAVLNSTRMLLGRRKDN